jgi:hypothetical protein
MKEGHKTVFFRGFVKCTDWQLVIFGTELVDKIAKYFDKQH